jgi:hypothetical protein
MTKEPYTPLLICIQFRTFNIIDSSQRLADHDITASNVSFQVISSVENLHVVHSGSGYALLHLLSRSSSRCP